LILEIEKADSRETTIDRRFIAYSVEKLGIQTQFFYWQSPVDCRLMFTLHA
jgi:hypothetical protein